MTATIGFFFLFLIHASVEINVRRNAGRALRAESSWDYCTEGERGPAFWEVMFPDYCAGSSQSPVNLQDAVPKTCEPFQFTGYDVVPDDMVILNNGHTAKATITMDPMPTVSGGCLGGTYEFLQMHWHWGASSEKGSEHQINGSPYSMELHLVHWNKKYASVGEALQNADGLAVLGIMVKEALTHKSDSPCDTVAKFLKSIRQAQQSTSMTPVALEGFLPEDISSYYRYSGSLTTPKCNEIVTWTVFEENVKISKKDMYEFRQLLDLIGKYQSDNYRPVQPLNGRTIYLINQ